MPRNTSGQRQGRADRGPGVSDDDNSGGRVPLRRDHRANSRGDKASNGLFRADEAHRKDC